MFYAQEYYKFCDMAHLKFAFTNEAEDVEIVCPIVSP